MVGQDEIESLEKLLGQALMMRPADCPGLTVCPLYGALAADAQLKVFEPAPKHARKVILATNIAETSLTINGACGPTSVGLTGLPGGAVCTAGKGPIVLVPVSFDHALDSPCPSLPICAHVASTRRSCRTSVTAMRSKKCQTSLFTRELFDN